MRQLEEDLEAACNEKESLVSISADTSVVDRRILLLRREQRRGPQLAEGELLSERYKLCRILGTGGYGDVWLALDRRTLRLVAVKILHYQWQRDFSHAERFDRGARKMLELDHPHIVRVLSEPLHDCGFHYFVMDYLSGGDLGTAIRLQTQPIEILIQNLLQVGTALTYAHELGLVHRDVKPENIVLDEKNTAHLTDFDLITGANITGGTIGGGLGSLVYSAPEQLDNASTADVRSDLYSLGMVAVSVFARQDIPHRAMRNIDKFIDSMAVNDAVKTTLRRATSWDASERHDSIAMFCQELWSAWQRPQAPGGRLTRPTIQASNEADSDVSFYWANVTQEQIIQALEGVWIADSGTTYCMKFVDGSLRCAYCYQGIGYLTGHIFDIKLSGDQLFGRFSWIKQPEICGYHYFRLVIDGSMVGSWCYSSDVRVLGGQGVIGKIKNAMRTQNMVSFFARRGPDSLVYPLWAEEYFAQQIWLTTDKLPRD